MMRPYTGAMGKKGEWTDPSLPREVHILSFPSTLPVFTVRNCLAGPILGAGGKSRSKVTAI